MTERPAPPDRPTAKDFAAARRRIETAERILLLTHVAPDGDAIGSLLGLYHALKGVGKTVVAACSDPVPDTFRFLPGSDHAVVDPRGSFDLVIALDAADLGRVGPLGVRADLPRPHIAIDHHITNPGFGEINLIDYESAATSELLAEHLDELGLQLNQAAAECLLSGIVGDTLGFRTSATNPKTLAIAQRLVATGVDLGRTIDLSLNKRSFGAIKLWGEGLVRLRLEHDIVWTTLPIVARHAAGYTGNGDADLVNLLTSVREASVAVVLTERGNGRVKVSWRSVPGINVGELAAAFGGGGHAQAAGAEIDGPLDTAEERVMTATRNLIQRG